MSLAGIFTFWCVIAWPAFRKTNVSRALAAESDRWLFIQAWISLGFSLVTGAVWLVMVGSSMSGQPAGAVIRGGVLTIVLTQTHFGIDWIVRAALIVVLALSLIVQARTRNHTSGWIGMIAAWAFIASLTWAGHGGATEDVPFDAFHAPADILHLLAAGAWLGGLLPLVLFLAEFCRDKTAEAVKVAQAATLRFSVLGVTCVGTLIVTGIVNTWFLAGNAPALFGTLYGQLLLLKIALFAAMIGVAAINQRKLLPLLADASSDRGACLTALQHVRRNASIEAVVGIVVLAIVGVIGILPPGLHTEPKWPFSFRFDLSEVTRGGQNAIEVAVAAFVLCLIATIVVAERKRYRETAIASVVLVLLGIVSFIAIRPGIVDAYPTSFYASPQAYAAPSVARGAPLYAQNCIACHGVAGRGDGPLAGKLPVRPADLTESHLFAHKVGEMYWWIGNGKGGVMPGFAGKLTSDQRWDLINFLLARAAGDLTHNIGSKIGSTAAAPLPDFAFEQRGAQNTLSQLTKAGPVLLVLYGSHAPLARLGQLAALQSQFDAVGLRVIAVGRSRANATSPLVVSVSQDVRSTLALFSAPNDGGETELMLDKGGNVRARWTASDAPDTSTLLADAKTAASIPVAAANHAGHGG